MTSANQKWVTGSEPQYVSKLANAAPKFRSASSLCEITHNTVEVATDPDVSKNRTTPSPFLIAWQPLAIGEAVAAASGNQGLADLLKLTEAAVHNGYQRYLENQVDRIVMEYMRAAGYDQREAPHVWKTMSKSMGGDHRTDFFCSSHDNNTTRRAYLTAAPHVSGRSLRTVTKIGITGTGFRLPCRPSPVNWNASQNATSRCKIRSTTEWPTNGTESEVTAAASPVVHVQAIAKHTGRR